MEESKNSGNKLTWILIAINVIVFELVFSLPEATRELVFEMFSFSFGNMFQIWRWFSSLFLHVDANHLFFNMLGLYFFGKVLEEDLDRKWWIAIYFAAGLLGNFAFMFTSMSPVIGASGCMFGLMGAAMFLKPLKKIHLYIFPLPLGIIAIILAIFESLMTAMGSVGQVANIAHVAGLITGAIFAFFHSPKQAAKGIMFLVILMVLLMLLIPFFLLITTIGGVILGVVESIVGFFLYGIANIISFLWTLF
ncbi:MAG: rhomboid family intramembrane serine protease [Candidatus Aenigmarchaeota archaeon]|nr:rhomboid family intramembrane serine protease [Candidatus Aenigmarchaeota archaeon]